MALNLVIRRCLHMARNESVRCLLYFAGSMLMNMMLDERKVKLVKSSLSSREVISFCARIRSTDNNFLCRLVCNKYDVRCEMSSDRVTQNFISYLYYMLKEEGKL